MLADASTSFEGPKNTQTQVFACIAKAAGIIIYEQIPQPLTFTRIVKLPVLVFLALVCLEACQLLCLVRRECVCPEEAQPLGAIGNLSSGAEPLQVNRDGVGAHGHDILERLVEAEVRGVVAFVGENLLHVGLICAFNLHHNSQEFVLKVVLIKAV